MNKRSIISIFAIVAILTACFTNIYATDNDKMTIELKVGSSTAKVNGQTSQVEKPYRINNTFMVPLAWIAEAIGAEVNKKASKIEIIYRDLNAELTIGSKTYIANEETAQLTVAPVIKNGRTMVPIEFITKNFLVSVTNDVKDNIKIVLEDDGALKDLSFLTGGITSKKIGNSFYGWSLSIPTGSRLVSNNFKSDEVCVENDSRELTIYINVDSKKDSTLAKLYDTIITDYNKIIESNMDLKADIPYIDYTMVSPYYDGAIRGKVFEKGEYFYYLTIICEDELVTPEKLMTDKYYENIVSSFDLNYKGNTKGIEDISKIKDGKAKFYNYVSFDNTIKYLTWSMDVPVNWENSSSYYEPLNTMFNFDNKHYMKIQTNILEEGINLNQYVDEIKRGYDDNFNPKLYSFIGRELTTVAGIEAQNLKFTMKYGNKVYHVEELYFVKDNFVYEISIYLPENGYEELLKEVINTIDKINIYTINKQSYQKDLDLYNSRYSGTRVSKQDDTFKFVNKIYNWSVEIPGYWTKYSYYSDSEITFKNEKTAACISISVIDKDKDYDTEAIKEEFGMDFTELIYDVKPTITETNEKGLKIKNYSYRIDDPNNDIYGNIIYRVFEKGDYIYCYESEIYDLGVTDKAIAEFDNAWKSFKLIDETTN